jgi:hypothetical protein
MKIACRSLILAAAALVVGCSGVPQKQIGIDAPSGSEHEFAPVGDYLEHRCGSLDCHGQVGRNLRIWGCEGMRLDAHDISSCSRQLGGTPTTPAEHQATYRSLVGLEPNVMTTVVEGHGQDPELLTFMRKATGLEAHSGGQLIVVGDGQYDCLVSWLAGHTDFAACMSAIAHPKFPVPDASTQ